MLYDTDNFTAYWVAYPLTASDLSGTRKDNWDYNPNIEEDYQIDIQTSYGVYLNGGSTGDYYARGHQIPSADRLSPQTRQDQVCWATNITPQIQNGFNGGIWNQLESSVRGAIPTSDTLYVVTGAILRTVGGSETVKWIQPKGDAKQCPVPNYYYKVLMKCSRNASGAITSASTVGVWLEHKSYSGTGDSWSNYTASVDEIEALTGYDFFTNLPDSVESAAETNSSWDAFTSF
jgi:endonuclease G